MKRLLVIVASVSLLASCDLFSGLAGGVAGTDDAPLVYFAESSGGAIDLSLSAAAGRSASVVFTTGPYDGLAAPTATARDSSVMPLASQATSASERSRAATDAASDSRRAETRRLLDSYSPPIAPRLSSTGDAGSDAVDDQANFTLYGEATGSTSATCRLVRSVDFGDRARSLSIWVADDEWGSVVDQGMVDALADAFFGPSGTPQESIYYWVTTMLGDEWGSGDSLYYNFQKIDTISASGNVTILLADIEGDNADDGGIVGYFYSGDTIPSFSYSNERVMFTIDSVMLAEADGSWDISDPWPSTVVSTLAHEFQHMIHFYQKGVLRGGDYFTEATWIDELCAMQVEDLLADKLGVAGPRGMDPTDYSAGVSGNIYGRLPEYLLFPDVTPYDWDTAADAELTRYYSWAYSFGAYLTRNYGGSEFIRRLVQSASTDAGAVEAAASAFSGRDESIVGLLRRWGAAALLSHRTDAPAYYRYNSGGAFSSSSGGVTYRLGSINMYNYLCQDGVDTDGDKIGDADLVGPYVYDSGTIDWYDGGAYDGEQYYGGGAYSNAFMDLGDPSSSSDWRFELPDGMYATIVID